MGLFPVSCAICGGYYCSLYAEDSHCQFLERELDNCEKKLSKEVELIQAIIKAYKSGGDCKQEILNAAYDHGFSVSKTEFVWLEDEIKRLKINRQGR